jgi:hypothetical protein
MEIQGDVFIRYSSYKKHNLLYEFAEKYTN